jgi:hypothetical protein
MKIWTLPLLAVLAVLAACSRTPANESAGGNRAEVNNAVAAPAPVAAAERPAPSGELACAPDRLSPEEREALGQLAAEQGSREDSRAQPLLRAVDACAAQFSWSPQKRNLALMHALARAGEAALRAEFGSRGIDLTELDRAIVGDRELMEAASSGQLGGTVGQAFALRHAALIGRLLGGMEDQALAIRIGNYIAFHALAETIPARFEQP